MQSCAEVSGALALDDEQERTVTVLLVDAGSTDESAAGFPHVAVGTPGDLLSAGLHLLSDGLVSGSRDACSVTAGRPGLHSLSGSVGGESWSFTI
jgi:hypothetical protein